MSHTVSLLLDRTFEFFENFSIVIVNAPGFARSNYLNGFTYLDELFRILLLQTMGNFGKIRPNNTANISFNLLLLHTS